MDLNSQGADLAFCLTGLESSLWRIGWLAVLTMNAGIL
jgi:hypothetical protein